jgi:hypothetical protein
LFAFPIRRPGEPKRGGNGHSGGPGTSVRAISFFLSSWYAPCREWLILSSFEAHDIRQSFEFRVFNQKLSTKIQFTQICHLHPSVRRPGEPKRGGNGHPGGPGTSVRAFIFSSFSSFILIFFLFPTTIARRRGRRGP